MLPLTIAGQARDQNHSIKNISKDDLAPQRVLSLPAQAESAALWPQDVKRTT